MERVKGIEPSSVAWEATALPLSYTRVAAIMRQLPTRPQRIRRPIDATRADTIAPMDIELNGEPRSVADGISISALLDEIGLGQRRVAVEVNREVIPRSRHAQHRLAPGDRIEIVHAIGGG